MDAVVGRCPLQTLVKPTRNLDPLRNCLCACMASKFWEFDGIRTAGGRRDLYLRLESVACHALTDACHSELMKKKLAKNVQQTTQPYNPEALHVTR